MAEVESPLGVVFKALRARLVGYAALWAERVYTGPVAPDAPYPYIEAYFVGGGQLNRKRKSDAELVIAVTIVARTLADALRGASLISGALNDSGAQDVRSALPLHPDWTVTTVTQGQHITDTDRRGDNTLVYIEGEEFAWRLESN